jgi:hypothetical protein
MRKLLALLPLFVPALAAAQTFPVPPDIQAIYGATGYIATSATYAAGTTQNVLGNGTTDGGTPPAYATMPADPAPSRPSGSTDLLTGTYSTPGNPATNVFCLVPTETFNGHACPEPKFRTHVLDNSASYDDAIRNYGLPGTSHCHTFFGADTTTAPAFATYQTLRAHAKSTAAGGANNGTLYWRPCFFTSARPGYAIRSDFNVVYYNTLDDTNRLRVVRIPRAHRYIGGFNMDDPDDSLVKREIAIANAQPGTTGRYVYRSNGNVGYRCVGGGNAADGQFVASLKTGAGTDAWQAAYGATCNGSAIQMTVGFPECWDGKNLWYPGGYKHMRQVIIDNLAPGDKLICPNGWYRLPQLQIIFQFTSGGPSDYQAWSLSSDAGAQAALNAMPACLADYSNAPCHEGVTARTLGAAESFHTDWIGAWKDSIMVQWQTNCLGIPSLGATNGHQCEPSVFSSTQGLNYTLADGRVITTTNTYGTGSTSLMFRVGSPHHGPATINHHM